MYSNEQKQAIAAGILPSFSPADYHRVQDAINDCFTELKQIAPALTDDQKHQVLLMLGITPGNLGTMGTANGSLVQYDVDEVAAQYQLVKQLRAKVLTPSNEIAERATAKDLSALITAMNGTIGLFMKNQEKIDHLKEMRAMREATILALKDMPEEVQLSFFKNLELMRSSIGNTNGQ